MASIDLGLSVSAIECKGGKRQGEAMYPGCLMASIDLGRVILLQSQSGSSS
jgi:hypothetical protein